MHQQPAEIHILHENDAWTAPLVDQLEAASLPYRLWHLNRGAFDLDQPPPPGIYYSRMSASSHTRGHRFAPEYAACVLRWLAQHRRRVINDHRALELELSKSAQYSALRAAGIRTPRTVIAVDRQSLIDAARNFAAPFITKHNRAGRGKGVKLFERLADLQAHLGSDEFELSPDGITLLQQYISSPEQCIVRVEFIGGKFVYAVRVDTAGSFELCPCDTESCGLPTPPQFSIIAGFDDPLVAQYEAFLRQSGVEVAAFEFVRDAAGTAYTYDINTNTNYNRAAEIRAKISAMARLSTFLGQELRNCSGAG
ncbi:MAG: alpha-L-glutamate ligase [Deltaproteobacteria bacterium]|nr:alpha-L-glutamate ligase [Deltaproteobacteria bacterium]